MRLSWQLCVCYQLQCDKVYQMLRGSRRPIRCSGALEAQHMNSDSVTAGSLVPCSDVGTRLLIHCGILWKIIVNSEPTESFLLHGSIHF